MAKIIDRHFIVKIKVGKSMMADSAKTYDTYASAALRAEKLASSGEYAEVRERTITENCRERFEPYDRL